MPWSSSEVRTPPFQCGDREVEYCTRYHPQICRRCSCLGGAGPTHPTPRSNAARHNTVHGGLTSRSRRQLSLREECHGACIPSVLLIALLPDDSHSNTLRSNEPRRVWPDDPTPTSGSDWSAASSTPRNQMRAGHWQARPARAPPSCKRNMASTGEGPSPHASRSGKSGQTRPWTLNRPRQGGTIA